MGYIVRKVSRNRKSNVFVSQVGSQFAVVTGVSHDPFDARNKTICIRPDRKSALAIASTYNA